MTDIQLYYYEIKTALRKCREAEYSKESVEHAAGLIKKLHALLTDETKKKELYDLLKTLIQKGKEAAENRRKNEPALPPADITQAFPLIPNAEILAGAHYNVAVIDSSKRYQDNAILLYAPFASELSYASRCYAKEKGMDLRVIDCQKLATAYALTATQLLAGLYKHASEAQNELIVYENVEGMKGAESVEQAFCYYVKRIRQEGKGVLQLILSSDVGYSLERIYQQTMTKMFPDADVINSYLKVLDCYFLPLPSFAFVKERLAEAFAFAPTEETDKFIKKNGLYLGFEGLCDILSRATADSWQKLVENYAVDGAEVLKKFVEGFGGECTYDFLDWEFKLKKDKDKPKVDINDPIYHPKYKLPRDIYDDVIGREGIREKLEKIMNMEDVPMRVKCAWVVEYAMDGGDSLNIMNLGSDQIKEVLAERWELAYRALVQLMRICDGELKVDLTGNTSWGVCCNGGALIRMNVRYLKLDFEILASGYETLLHEAFHALQHSARTARRNNDTEAIGYYFVHFGVGEDVFEWEKNSSRYYGGDGVPFEDYYDQVVEADARIFAEMCVSDFANFNVPKLE